MKFLLFCACLVLLTINSTWAQYKQRVVGGYTVFTIPLFTINPNTNRPSLTELPITCYDHEAEYYSIMIAKPGIPPIENNAYLATLFATRNRSERFIRLRRKICCERKNRAPGIV